MIKIVLFDVDGVLLNGESFSIQLERDFGISKATMQPFFKSSLPASTIGASDMKQDLVPYLKAWGWKGTVDEFVDYWFKAEHVIDEPLIEYVETLSASGIGCYLATNQEKYRIAYILEKMEFEHIFDGQFVSSEMGVKKPDPKYFEQVIEKLQPHDPSEILFWDDRIENVEAARAAGLQAEVYSSFEAFDDQMKELLG
jgi:putative hydrolase of the HAD superfamily